MGSKLKSQNGVRLKCKDPIFRFFIRKFKDLFKSANPKLEDVSNLFEWLSDEARYAMSFADINTINYCRRLAEWKLSKLLYKKEVRRKSRIVSRELVHRFDELRTTKKITKGRLAIFQGHKEEEKALPSK